MPRKKVPKKRTNLEKASKTVTLDDYFAEDGTLLNVHHELFLHAWLQTFDVKKSLSIAGLGGAQTEIELRSHKRKILIRPECQRRVREILNERCKELAVDENWVILQMFETYQKAIEEQPIVNKDGEIVGYERSNLRTAAVILESLGKNIGMFQKASKPQRVIILKMDYGQPEQPAQITRQPLEGQANRLN